MAVQLYGLSGFEFNSATGEIYLVADAESLNLPLPDGIGEYNGIINYGQIRLGPIKVGKTANPIPICYYNDPVTYDAWKVTWNAATNSWGTPVRNTGA